MITIKKWFQGDRIGYLFVLPATIFMLAFVGYPIISNIIMGFQDVSIETFSQPRQLVGFKNYIELFKGGLLTRTIGNTLYYTFFSLILQFTLGFALALFFNRKFALAKPLRGFVIITWLIPATITALLFKFMFTMDGGIINQTLLQLGLIAEPIGWLIQPKTAMWALIIANTWVGVPFNMILLATGLTTISKDYYESASLDGANTVQKFVHITLPCLRSSIEAVLILGFIYTFKVFDLVYVMTGGGPVDATEMLSTYSYRLSFSEYNFSKGAAVANVLFAILFVIGLFYLRLMKDEEDS